MASREILFCGHPVLRRKAKRISKVTPEVLELLEEMKQTLVEAPGVGLAAPQVGASVRAIVVREDVGSDEEEGPEIIALINPRIVQAAGEMEGLEGCLSLPTLQGIVLRPAQVTAEGLTPEGEKRRVEADGLMARVLQHEIDHLDGILFLDRVEADTLGWMVPDENEDGGYRVDPATVPEVMERFRRLAEKKEKA